MSKLENNYFDKNMDILENVFTTATLPIKIMIIIIITIIGTIGCKIWVSKLLSLHDSKNK